MHWRGLLLVMSTGLLSGAAFAQNSTFTGHVTDSSGAVIGKALITVHNEETGVDTRTTTTTPGDYTVPYLAPGHYSISAEANGFKREEKVNTTLEVSQTAVINFVLQVGGTTET